MKTNAIGLILIGFIIMVGGCRQKSSEEQAAVPIPVKVREVMPVVQRDSIRLSGTIRPLEQAGLSFKVPGRIKAIHVDEGDRVTKGMRLAELEPDDYELRVRIAEAQLKALEPEYRRMQTLLADNAVTQADYDQLEAQYRVADCQMDLARMRLADCVLYAPIAGEVAEKKADKGEMASPERVVLILINLAEVEAEAGVPDIDIHRFTMGDEVSVSLSALPDVCLTGKVVRIGSMPDPVSRTYTVRIRLPNRQGRLKAGMIVTLEVLPDREGKEVVGAPLAAVLHSPESGPYVFIAGHTGRAVFRPVRLGRMMARNIEILEGVSPGDRLIVSGQHYVRDGSSIFII